MSRRPGLLFLWPFIAGFILFSLGQNAPAAEWLTLKDCRYIPNPANDGDSFHVRADNREYIFRLYFVDTPETDNRVRTRVRAQAKYFRVPAPQVLQIGDDAERFTRRQLARPFTVRTCMQDARGRSRLRRYFALVETSDGGDLGEKLVANGLARVYGSASEPPGMNTRAEWRRLERLEQTARQQKVGGWEIGLHRVTPDGTVTTQRDDLYKAAASTDTKLNINTATPEQLMGVPGIGHVLAERIVEARPFRSADDLERVKGIKTRKYEQLRPYFE